MTVVGLFSLCLQPLTSSYLEQVVELDRLSLGGLWTLEGYRRELESPNSSLWVLSRPVGGSDGETAIGLGCFWAILEEAHITLLAVHPDYQGQGLGQLLLYTLLKEARHRQLERATLEVRASNQAALSLYQKFGFQMAGRRKGYYPVTGEDALILWRGDLARAQFAESLTVWQGQVGDKLEQSGFSLPA